MAVDFAPQQSTAQPTDWTRATRQTHSATGTPINLSPTSPRTTFSTPSSSSSTALPYLGFQTRQLRPPKSPLYIPAVLRPTERPQRYSNLTRQGRTSGATSPLTPPLSAGNSFDGKDAGILANVTPDGMPRRCRDSDALTQGVTRIVTDEWNQDNFEVVTGLPTRDHWKPDSSSHLCDAAACDTQFSLLVRRHHCRRCGNIFCASHSIHHVPLDQHARFHPEGTPARACASCWNDYKTWRSARKARTDSSSTDGSGSGTTTPKGCAGQAQTKVKEVVAGSVPRDWNWSTF